VPTALPVEQLQLVGQIHLSGWCPMPWFTLTLWILYSPIASTSS